VRCSCCRVGDAHSTDLCRLFSLFYTTFSHPDPSLKPWGFCTCLIMMLHVSFSPNLSAVTWHVLRNDLRDLRKWRKCKLAFPSLGWRCWGWVYKNQNQNEYQMAEPCGFCTCLIMMKHVQFSPNLYTTALTVLRNLPRDLQAWGHANWPARLQVELYNGNWKIINKHCISWKLEHVENIPKFNFKHFKLFLHHPQCKRNKADDGWHLSRSTNVFY
jgi:hypothetical protein